MKNNYSKHETKGDQHSDGRWHCKTLLLISFTIFLMAQFADARSVFRTNYEPAITTCLNDAFSSKSEALTGYDLLVEIQSEECFSEDFSDITGGNSTSSSGSNTLWSDGNANFPTVVRAYQAGGAVRLGTGSFSGSIESKELNDVSGDVTIKIMVKGWTNIEGDLKVSLDGQEETISYTAKMADPFEEITIDFAGVAAGAKLKIETTAKRAFIDEVSITCASAPPPPPEEGEVCFSEDFSVITNGNNTDSNGANSSWVGNSNFPTVVKAYQAGGAVKLGTSSDSGSIESKELNDVSGDVTIKIMVKGWTNIEGDLKVSLDGQEETISYTAKMADPFEEITIDFAGVAAGAKLKIETTAKRAFIDEVSITCQAAECNTTEVVCQDISVSLDEQGYADIEIEDVYQSGQINCQDVTPVSISPNTFNCGAIGDNLVTVTVEDDEQNTANCTATVSVVDDIIPTVSCKDYTVALDEDGQATITANDVYDAGYDNCGTVIPESVTPNSFDCSDMGNNEVALTVVDANGNHASCTATVTVVDNIPPVVICNNYTAELNANGQVSVSVADIFDPQSSDNCGTVTPIVLSPDSFTCANLGENSATLTATDANQNIATCTVTITVVNKIAPTVFCQDIIVALDGNGQASITPADVFAGGSANCGAVNWQSLTPSAFTCSNWGSNTVALTVNDDQGNTASCTAIVTVEDNEPPVISCKNFTIALAGNGIAEISPEDVFAGGSDNCVTVNLLSVEPGSFGCDDVGSHTVTLTADDGHGNEASCTSTVTIQGITDATTFCEALPDSISLNADGYFKFTGGLIDNVSLSSCGFKEISFSPSLLSCDNIGENTIEVTITDDSDNKVSCTSIITVKPFVNIINVIVTNETCEGETDGSITIIANAPAGNDLLYSISGGSWFQNPNTFSHLTPGVYKIVVLAKGTNGCEAIETVEILMDNTPQIWYLDADADGYSPGQTIKACAQPAGYSDSTLGDDCNDNDAGVHSPITYFRDADGDGFGSTMQVSLCISTPPQGYADNSDDCNDSRPNIYPGAPELCNNIDDNCNGEVDEDLSDMVYVGNVAFATQAQVDAWLPCFSIIQGNLSLQGVGIANLNALSNLVEVTGNVSIQATGLTSLAPLSGLSNIGGSLTIQTNMSLADISALENLLSVGGNLMVRLNSQLSVCCGISHLIDSDPANGWVAGTETVMLNKTGGDCISIPVVLNTCEDQPIAILSPGNQATVNSNLFTDIRKMSLYPNPANTEATITFEGKYQSGLLGVYDVTGRLMSQRDLAPNSSRELLDLRGWAPGVYLVQAQLDAETLVQRLVVE